MPRRDLVDPAPLREAVLSSPDSLSVIAERAEFWRRKRSSYYTTDGVYHPGDLVERPDTARLKVALGLKGGTGKNRGTDPAKKKVTYELALRIAEAAGVDPVDVGL